MHKPYYSDKPIVFGVDSNFYVLIRKDFIDLDWVLEYDDWIVILCFVTITLVISIGLCALPWIILYNLIDHEKVTSYECGFQPFEDTRQKFDIKYYLVSILFIIFDLEIVFMVPWTMTFYWLSTWGTFWLMFFLFILTLGFVYEWKKGVLDWS